MCEACCVRAEMRSKFDSPHGPRVSWPLALYLFITPVLFITVLRVVYKNEVGNCQSDWFVDTAPIPYRRFLRALLGNQETSAVVVG
jgi:hypothetical protein